MYSVFYVESGEAMDRFAIVATEPTLPKRMFQLLIARFPISIDVVIVTFDTSFKRCKT
ncbi:conserved hypothetical protein [Paraburkholderia caribensis]|nr:conserved hypothetical protein [Paraburkholderia caribensis]